MEKSKELRRSALLPLGAALTGMVLTPVGMAAQGTPGAETALPTVNVQSERERQDTYQPGIGETTKLPLLPRDIPASITTIPQELIYDRSADTFREALRNVPSLTFNAGEGGRVGDNITLRGYSVVGDIYLDGIRDIAQYNRDLFNIERIDVLRGSASVLFGRGSTGGIINQISKVPILYDRYEATLTAGAFDYFRETVDLNKKIGDNAAVRLNLMKTDSDSFRKGVETDRLGFAPSVRWGIGTRNEFMLSYYHLEYDDVPDLGVPFFNGRPVPVPVENFYGLANADYQRDQVGIATASWTHRFDADTSIKTVLRRGDYSRDLRAVAPRLPGGTTVLTPATLVNRQAQRRGGEEETLTSQTDYITKFNTGNVKHLLNVGLELMDEKAERFSFVGGAANPPTLLFNPNPYPPLPANLFSATRGNQVFYDANTYALYAQDMLELTPMWKVVLGGRWDYFSADYNRPAPQGDLLRVDRVFSYRAGLLYQPTDFASYYVAYGTSFNPSGELYSLDDRGANTPPEKNRNMEVGAKWEFADGNLSLRTALFRSEKTNERNTDLTVTIQENLLTGKRYTQGVEFEAAGRITPKWEVFSGLALLDSEITAATGQQANTLGNRPINTPDYTYNLWTVYRPGGGWQLGGGVEGVGDRYGNTTNTNVVPSYTRLDGMVSYEQRYYEIKLNVLNLLDTNYYEGVYSGHVIPSTKRQVLLTAKLKY